ncbi:MAG: BON domain-containing protein [Chloroflexi bacterium]|nr:BON domain-containing protein [Chloroflexota bacterium]
METQELREDDRIKHDVKDALMADSRLDVSGLNVDVVGGTVYLTGVIPSLVQKRTARQVIGRIKGVLKVLDELKVVPLTARSDADIERGVNAALLRDVLVDETKVDVRVINGVVTLTGTVDNFAAKRAVEDMAWATHGVVDVLDHITIESHSPRADEEIARDVLLHLERNLRVKPKQVHVDVRNGLVTLDGHVSTTAQQWIAEELVRWVPGVTDVEDNLEVR